MVEYYSLLQQARQEMLNKMTDEELASSGFFKAVSEELYELEGAYQTAKEQLDEKTQAALELFNAQGFGEGNLLNDIDSLKEFAIHKNQIYDTLAQQYGLTVEEIDTLLRKSEQFKDILKEADLLKDKVYGREDISGEQKAGIAD